MFDVGFWELSLIAIVALVVVGPERLPSLVNEAGKWAGRARASMRDLKYELQRKAEIDELSELSSYQPPKLKKTFNDLVGDLDEPVEDNSKPNSPQDDQRTG